MLEAEENAWRTHHTLLLTGTVQYTKEGGKNIMLIAAAILCGFLLDALLGDPAWLPHPVVLMGKAISALEKTAAQLVSQNAGRRKKGWAGTGCDAAPWHALN